MSVYQLTGGAADRIRAKINDTAAHEVAGDAERQTPVPWFQVNEISGGTPNLTVEVYNASTTTSYYLGSGGVTWNAKAMTAKQSVTFSEGIMLEVNEFIRVTISASAVDVVGQGLLSNN